MKRQFPFLYEVLVERILSSERDRPRVMLWAGRSLGKSGVLEEIEHRLEARSPGSVVRVEGKKRTDDDPVDQIRQWAASPAGVLLVDDLDRCYGEPLEEILKSLPEDAEGRWRIIITVCRLDDVEGADWAGSPSLNTFHREPLDPWESPGQAAGAIKDALGQLGRAHRAAGHQWTPAPLLTGKAPDLVEAWVGSLIMVSDGHPALLCAGFEALTRLLERYASAPSVDRRLLILPTDQAGIRRWRQEVQEFLNDQVYASAQGKGAIGAAIHYFRRNRPRDFAALVELAQNPKGQRIRPARLRHALRQSGLVFRHPGTGNLQVAGALTRQWIQEIAEQDGIETGAQDSGSVGGVQPSDLSEIEYDIHLVQLGEGQGEVAFLHPPGREPFEARGRSWGVLQILASASPGEFLTVPRLTELTGAPTEGALRSTLQRLRRDLSAEGVGDLIENKVGQGFRIRRRRRS